MTGEPVCWADDCPKWYSRAACTGLDTALFFPVGQTGRALDQIARAKAICAACPVALQCLDYALDTGQTDGVWGGTTEDERRTERRRRQQRGGRP